MENLKMKSPNIAEQHVEKIKELFPNCVVEVKDEESGELKHVIDFDLLRQELSDSVIEGLKERYQFTWPGKKESILLLNSPTTLTLRPLMEKSKNFNGTKNVYVEGDNLETLKIIRETYMGKIKMIYIDPPYNTGNDFVYSDDFKVSSEEFLEGSGNVDSAGNRLVANSDSIGRYHTNWLNMMYPRLSLARDLLSDDGVIFISIDDNEQTNLRKLCDEIFGDQNMVAQIPWQSRASIQNDTDFSINHEYVLAYAKNRRQTNRRLKESNAAEWYKRDSFVCRPLPLDPKNYDNPDNDPRGPWKADPMDAPNIRPNLTYTIKNPNTGEEFLPPKGRHWRTEEGNFLKWLADNRIVFGKDGKGRPQLKVFYNEKKDFGSIDTSWFSSEKVGTTTQGTKELMSLFEGEGVFDMPKPTSLLKKLINLANLQNDDTILDFFSGSGSTADAIMQYNVENGTDYRFILVQLPENTTRNVFAEQKGLQTICDIGEERIRRRALALKKDSPNVHKDFGMRVFKVDSSNMKNVFYNPSEYTPDLLDNAETAIKPDRSSLDLLIQVMLELGITLDADIQSGVVKGVSYYAVNGNDLIGCFDGKVDEDSLTELAKLQPLTIAFRDDSFLNDTISVNCEGIFKQLSPSTKIKIV